jgi:hypothetical protein
MLPYSFKSKSQIRRRIFSIAFFVVISLIAAFLVVNKAKDSTVFGPGEIKNFEECIEAGFTRSYSYPAQCRTLNGEIFTEELAYPTISKKKVKIPVSMANPPLEKICDYPLVIYSHSQFVLSSQGKFNASHLREAQSCGTKVIVTLSGPPEEILNENGIGLSLPKFEEKLARFKGVLDPYLKDGTIAYHLVVNQPHNCQYWGSQCPSPAEIDEASQISKIYWPTLKTMVTTTTKYAPAFKWRHTDLLNLEYGYHQGPLDQFIKDSVEIYESSKANTISWSILALVGGFTDSGRGIMTPIQVEEIGQTMCDTKIGKAISFINYNEKILTREMKDVIGKLQNYCQEKF